ncbi:MAG: helix-turn-helix transcriptional regulator [Bacteroidota bacterium]
MDIGSTIKKIRGLRGLKQNDLASRCELTQAYLSKIESNQKEPTLSVLKKIALELNVPLPVLFFQALTVEDIEPKKRDAFQIILPSIKSMIESFF